MQSDSANRWKSKTGSFELWKSLDFWQEQAIDLIPLLMAIAVTRKMEIYGWKAFPVYLLVVNTSRQLLEYLSSARPRDLNPDNPKVADCSIDCTIVHAIPQRIRLRVPLLAEDIAYGQRLEKLLTSDPQVTHIRLNCPTASIAIAYKSPETSLAHWLEILESAKKESGVINDDSYSTLTIINHRN